MFDYGSSSVSLVNLLIVVLPYGGSDIIASKYLKDLKAGLVLSILKMQGLVKPY